MPYRVWVFYRQEDETEYVQEMARCEDIRDASTVGLAIVNRLQEYDNDATEVRVVRKHRGMFITQFSHKFAASDPE